jgi:hypothetical protein
MATGPKGEKRPADVVGTPSRLCGSLPVMKPEDFGAASAKNQAAAELGRAGGR